MIMKYYVIADVHGFYSEMIKALTDAGFFSETEPCMVIACGDILDRGSETTKVIDFMLKLHEEGKLIYILGNHEDLLCDCMLDISRSGTVPMHHYHNRTWDSLLHIGGMTDGEGHRNMTELVQRVRESKYYRVLLPAAVDYFETEKYVFVHGWLPCITADWNRRLAVGFDKKWRRAEPSAWRTARWFNGMELACKKGFTAWDKTVVCGHWHASYGHSVIEKNGSEFGADADFSPFYGEGIIAIDGCTAASGIVNCIVIEDNELEA